MNKLIISLKTLLMAIVVFAFHSCVKENPIPKAQSDTAIRIMPLGASRVQGNRPKYESFRYELWKDLIENDWSFDFIGTQTDKASYPSLNGVNFDEEHEGRGGWTSGEILNGINTWLSETDTPDIVLFSSPGGNDALQGLSYSKAIFNTNAIIDALQSHNPNITILIEQMAPGNTSLMTQVLKEYFENLQKDMLTIASDQTTSKSKVIAVDMHTGFTDAMLADPVHYNEAGAEFIATRYYNALVTVLGK